MIFRLLVGVGLFALGYYVGREVARSEPARDKLREARDAGSGPTRTRTRPSRPPHAGT